MLQRPIFGSFPAHMARVWHKSIVRGACGFVLVHDTLGMSIPAWAVKPQTMKNTLVFALSSRQSLTEAMARRQISTLVNFDGGIVCPDKWGTFEPLKTPFDAEDIDIPVQGLAKPQGDFFYRKGKPIHLSGEIYNRTHPPTARFPSPLFTIYWVGRFEGSGLTE